MMKIRTNKVFFFIVLLFFCNVLISSALFKSVSAWSEGNSAEEPLIVKSGSGTPIIDGIYDSLWSEANFSVVEFNARNVEFYAMLGGDFLFILVQIRISNHEDGEFVRIFLSNSTLSDETDFLDAKLIQSIDFNSENSENWNSSINDQSLEDSSYVNDGELDFDGAANLSVVNKFSIYEFKIPVDNNESDTFLDLYNVYALKIQHGTVLNENIETISSPLYIQLGISIDGENTEITELIIDLDAVSFVMFIIVLVSFGIITFTVYRSKVKII